MSFEQQIIFYSSPCMCGIKPANMFTVSSEVFCSAVFSEWKKQIALYGLDCFFVELSGCRILIFVYNDLWIKKILSVPSVRTYLERKGYDFEEDESFSVHLKMSFGNASVFPHEVGVLLGYPLEDVIAFEKFNGKNSKYCGIWKCYSDVENARLCETRFRECTALCRKWYEEGRSVNQIIKKYKERGVL